MTDKQLAHLAKLNKQLGEAIRMAAAATDAEEKEGYIFVISVHTKLMNRIAEKATTPPDSSHPDRKS